MDASSGVWVGTAFLFVQSTSEKIALSSLHNDSTQKPRVYKALKLALSDSAAGGVNAIDMLKVYCNDHQLIIYLKFCDRAICRRFLQSYRDGVVQRSLQEQLRVALSLLAVPIQVELKVGSEKLDDILDEEERCLEYIYKQKPDRLRDEEIAELEECLRTLNCGQEKRTQISQENSSLPGKPQDSLSPGTSERRTVTFLFQAQEFVDRPLTSEEHQKFSKLVGRKWKQVGRSLQKYCRALRDPVIDNLSYEHEKEGLYEQAYQMLLRFIQSEGKKATLQKLVGALQESGLTSMTEELLGIQHNEDDLS